MGWKVFEGSGGVGLGGVWGMVQEGGGGGMGMGWGCKDVGALCESVEVSEVR